MKCCKCEKEIKDGVKFCPLCGANQEENKAKIAATAGLVYPAKQMAEKAKEGKTAGQSAGSVEQGGNPSKIVTGKSAGEAGNTVAGNATTANTVASNTAGATSTVSSTVSSVGAAAGGAIKVKLVAGIVAATVLGGTGGAVAAYNYHTQQTEKAQAESRQIEETEEVAIEEEQPTEPEESIEEEPSTEVKQPTETEEPIEPEQPEEEAPVVEEEEAVSQETVRELYTPVIEQYAQVMNTPSTDDFYNMTTDGFQVKYAFADIDSNGIEECILKYVYADIGTTEGMSGDHADATCIYTVENGEVVKVLGEVTQPEVGVTGCVRIFQGSNWIMRAYSHTGMADTFQRYENGRILEENSLYGYYEEYSLNDQRISEAEYENKYNEYTNGEQGYPLTVYDGPISMEAAAEEQNTAETSDIATTGDVTTEDVQKIEALISEFQNYLSAVLEVGEEIAYEDDATKTGMLLWNRFEFDKPVEELKEEIEPLFDQYFTSGQYLLKEYVEKADYDMTELFCAHNGKSIMRAIDLGAYGGGKVSEVNKVESDYIVKYDVYVYDFYSNEKKLSDLLMGSYTIVLKKDGDRFKIHNITTDPKSAETGVEETASAS